MNIQKHGGQDNFINIEHIKDFSTTTNFLQSNDNGLNNIKNNLNLINFYPPDNYQPYKNHLINFIFNNHKINNNIILGNGASELIDLLIRTINTDTWRPNNCVVQYLEYERSCELTNKIKKKYNDKESKLLCIINPNNPTGKYLNINDLKNYINDNCEINTHVIVDGDEHQRENDC